MANGDLYGIKIEIMNKQAEYIVLGLGIASILFALYGMIRGNLLTDVLSGIIIGTALIGTVIIQRNKKTK